MAIQQFTLKSGVVLQVDDQPAFDKSIGLVEVVMGAIMGKDPEMQFDHVALFNPVVRAAVFEIFPWCIYDNQRLTADMFNDPKSTSQVCKDWLEIALKIIEVNKKRFFTQTSSGLKAPGEGSTKDQK